MKKFMSIGTIGLSALFVISLANAHEGRSTYQGSTSTDSNERSASRTDKYAKMKNCNDDSGYNFHIGEEGFDTCVEKMRERDQMAGEADFGVPSKESEKPSSSNWHAGPAWG